MRQRSMTQNAISAALHSENKERCDPPLEADEVERIAQSILRYEPGSGEPIDWPEPQPRASRPVDDAQLHPEATAAVDRRHLPPALRARRGSGRTDAGHARRRRRCTGVDSKSVPPIRSGLNPRTCGAS